MHAYALADPLALAALLRALLTRFHRRYFLSNHPAPVDF
jgi:hypothetical protein